MFREETLPAREHLAKLSGPRDMTRAQQEQVEEQTCSSVQSDEQGGQNKRQREQGGMLLQLGELRRHQGTHVRVLGKDIVDL